MLKHTRNQENVTLQISKKLKICEHQGLARIWTKRNSQTSLIEVALCTTLENDLATSSDVKDAYTLCTSNSTSRDTLKKLLNMHKKICTACS